MSLLLQDLRFAFRTLRKNLGVTLLATLSLGLAIAGNTTVYSLVNSFLYRPIPYQDVDRLVLVGETNSDVFRGQLSTTSQANFTDLMERQRSFQASGGFQGAAYTYDAGGDVPEQLTVGEVTPGFFEILGAKTQLGRTFADEEGVSGRDRVVAVSHEFWTQRMGSRQDLAGETLRLNGEPYEVVGVVEESFEWILAPNTDLWVPLVIEAGRAPRQRRNLFAVARLADGVDQEAAESEMSGLMEQLTTEYPEANRGYSVELLNMREDIPDSRNRVFFGLMQVALLFVLLIACANIANLLLARSQAREREIAIRTSIGASRRRIIGQLFTESMVMASIAGLIGVSLGVVGMRLMARAFGAFLPSFWVPTLDLRVLAYTAAVTLFGGVLFGLAPVLQTARFNLLSSLKDGTQGATAGGRRRLVANVLVVAEIAFALAFLAGASIMINTFQTMQTADAGFATEKILVMRLDLPDSRYATPLEQTQAVDEIVARLSAVPGAAAVTVSNQTPRTPVLPQDALAIDGRPVPPDETPPQVDWMTVGPAFFDTTGIRLRRGRVFVAADGYEAPRVAVVNQAFADRFFAQDDALSRRVTIQGEPREIVGVVENVRHGVIVGNSVGAAIYLPWNQRPANAFSLSARADTSPGALAEPIRKELLAFDRTVTVTQVQTLDDFVEQFWVGQRVFSKVLAGFGALALLLAALGTYGVLAYAVVQRRHEIGIRMAIGASRRAVVGMITRRGLLLALCGVALGIPLVLVEVKVIASIFSGLVPVKAGPVLGVSVLLTAVTLLASFLPAHRAASIDPLEALRTE